MLERFVTADGAEFWRDVPTEYREYRFPVQEPLLVDWIAEPQLLTKPATRMRRFVRQEAYALGVRWTTFCEVPGPAPHPGAAWSIVGRLRRSPDEAHVVQPAPRLVRELGEDHARSSR